MHFLRDDLGVTSTHVGCDTIQCGACKGLGFGSAGQPRKSRCSGAWLNGGM